jgi:cytochrome c-type biogenesis protein
MKPALNFTRYALLTLVAVSLGSWVMRTFSSEGAAGAGATLPADGIVVVITWGLLSAPSLSSFLQEHMNQLLGPLLVLVGMALLGMLPGLPSFGKGGGGGLNEKLMSFGLVGCVLMGFVFALTFCPVSAALFFGSLLPLAVREQSAWLVPALFGIGSAAPVLLFALALAISREAAGRAYRQLQSAQRWIAPASGWLLVAIGVWMCLHLTLRVF